MTARPTTPRRNFTWIPAFAGMTGRRILRGRRGFTLIELLVVLAIQGVVLAAVVTSFTGQLTAYDLQEQLNEMQQTARAAMTMLVREARLAGYDPTGTGIVGAPYDADPTRLRITADRNGDGDVLDANERVTYFHDPGRRVLRRRTGVAGQPVAENVQAFTVEYLDAAGNPTTVSSAIRRLRITVTTRTAKQDPRYPHNGGRRTHTLRSLVTPANLGN